MQTCQLSFISKRRSSPSLSHISLLPILFLLIFVVNILSSFTSRVTFSSLQIQLHWYVPFHASIHILLALSRYDSFSHALKYAFSCSWFFCWFLIRLRCSSMAIWIIFGFYFSLFIYSISRARVCFLSEMVRYEYSNSFLWSRNEELRFGKPNGCVLWLLNLRLKRNFQYWIFLIYNS